MSGTGKLDGREREGRGLAESGRGMVLTEQERRHQAAQVGPRSDVLAGHGSRKPGGIWLQWGSASNRWLGAERENGSWLLGPGVGACWRRMGRGAGGRCAGRQEIQVSGGSEGDNRESRAHMGEQTATRCGWGGRRRSHCRSKQMLQNQ